MGLSELMRVASVLRDDQVNLLLELARQLAERTQARSGRVGDGTSLGAGVNWQTMPDLLTLAEVVELTREKIATAYLKLSQARYPIACLPDVRPYKFPKKNVRAFIEEGRVTANVNVRPRRFSRRARWDLVDEVAPAPPIRRRTVETSETLRRRADLLAGRAELSDGPLR